MSVINVCLDFSFFYYCSTIIQLNFLNLHSRYLKKKISKLFASSRTQVTQAVCCTCFQEKKNNNTNVNAKCSRCVPFDLCRRIRAVKIEWNRTCCMAKTAKNTSKVYNALLLHVVLLKIPTLRLRMYNL